MNGYPKTASGMGSSRSLAITQRNCSPSRFRSVCSSGSTAMNASSCSMRNASFPTASTSVWNAPPSIPDGDCWGNRHASGCSWCSRASAWDASSVCRAGKRSGPFTGLQVLRPQAKRCIAGRPSTASRMWFAAPSSAK